MSTMLSISLTTQPSLLRSKLKATRSILVGLTLEPVSNPVQFSEGSPSAAKNSSKPIWRKAVDTLAVIAIALSLIVGGALAAPRIFYLLTPVETVPVQASEEGTPLGGQFSEGTKSENSKEEQKPAAYLPPKDATLPEGKWIIIPRIGVRTQLQETETAEEALLTGVWKAPGYGEAGSTDLPLILAAHRFGWQWWWQSDYWKYNSFYLLPSTEPGDIVEIIDDQRKWTYEIYAGAEGGDITDYDADMILYTCKFLNSPIRHFRYARLVNPEQDSQN